MLPFHFGAPRYRSRIVFPYFDHSFSTNTGIRPPIQKRDSLLPTTIVFVVENITDTITKTKRGVPLVSWKSCCASVDEGGLGLRQLVLLNQSLLLKRCWEIYSSSAVSCLFIRNIFWRGGLMRRSYVPSSIWPGVKKFWSVVMENAQWLIGQGTNISFWRDNFMGKPIIDFFGPHTIVDNLQGYVADYISNGSWVIPDLLHFHYPALCELIEKVPLAMDPSVEDKVIWSSATSGELTAKNAFQFLCQPFPSMSWGKCIWSKFITPRMSLLTWKLLWGRILSDDFLQRRGVALASRCGLCGTIPSSLIEVWQVGLVNRSPQLKELWLACFTTVLWFIWQARNKMKHEGQGFNVAIIYRLIVGHVQAASRIASGYMTNSLLDLQVLKHFGVQCKLRRTPSVIEVMAVIKAIELAWVRDWKHVWLKVDSSLVLNFLQSPDLVPWQLHIEWGNCLYRISQMQFQSSHIFREGNRVADALANYGVTSSDLTWWDLAPPFIDRHCQSDSLGMPNFHFC
ncbi:putative ribonuclease H-like domain, reverse transcriptase zinc-binding domain-containing protein [Rosa chinensis]|uniref:Putative ribonuclease H-like domain, reverse transcriptase zinc-binding domain-containing protein n=1 Tax=Rosa chinensis TaxID=74649 RepID=A0A2P6QM40_ROSCH|nr:putative ribonuclease H-like domain, reverse transcriptase zinc-binding domain-containing protein [Rosa chinensis]